ncbi:CHAT domain-containing protein [Streptomyces sp. NPDC047461]|uniref:CHAT domain-containing protein n=1 Tax=Streptomyces sp. NPDC047461 TaxID=3155619 RepID=UPI0033E51201
MSEHTDRREALCAELAARVNRCADSGDPGELLDATTLDLVAALTGATPDVASDAGVSRVAGLAHLGRYLHLPDGLDQLDLCRALAFFRPWYQARPELVPELLAEYFDAYPELVGDDVLFTGSQAARLLTYAVASEDVGVLDEAIDALRQTLDGLPADHPERPDHLGNLSGALRLRHRLLDDPAALDDAVGSARQALAGTDADGTTARRRLVELSAALRVRFERTGRGEDIREAIAAARRATTGPDSTTPDADLASALFHLGNALLSGHRRPGHAGDLDKAVEAHEQSLAALPDDLPDYATHLATLSAALLARYRLGGSIDDLEAASAAARQAVTSTEPGLPERRFALGALGEVLLAHGVHSGRRDLLDQAVDRLEEALDGPRPDLTGLVRLGRALHRRAEHTGAREDMDRAVEVLRRAVEATAGDAERAARLSDLAAALRGRFERTGSRTDLDEAGRRLDEALAAVPNDHPDRPRHLSHQAEVLHLHAGQSGDPAVLGRAVALAQQAVASTTDADPHRPKRLSTLALVLESRAIRTGARDDLDEAVRILRAVANARSADHPDRALHQANLGSVLRTCAELDGDPEIADEAVTASRAAVEALAPDHTNRAGMLSNLGAALITRFRHGGMLDDLAQAVDCQRAALTVLPADHADRTTVLMNLGSTLLTRFETDGRPADLDDAVNAARKAVTLAAADHPDRALLLSTLGMTLLSRHEHHPGDAPMDGDAALVHLREALDVLPTDHPDRAGHWSNLGLALLARFERDAMPEHLDDGVHACRQAVAAVDEDHPDATMYLVNLAAALFSRCLLTGSGEDLRAVTEYDRRAARVAAGPPAMRLAAARQWAATAALAERWELAAAGHTTAVGLVGLVAPPAHTRSDTEHALRGMVGLGADAAAGCLHVGRTEDALTLWEQSVDVLTNRLLDARLDVTELRRAAPRLANRFETLRAELDVAPPTGASQPGRGGATALRVDTRRRAAAELARVLDRIRVLPDFARFQLPPTTEELLATAVHGPVVVLTVSELRSDALILTPEGIEVVALPGVTPRAVQEQVENVLTYLDPDRPKPDAARRREERAAFEATLGWLWDGVTGPVLDRFDTPPTRLWWCPSGLLSMLPLHAAGHHSTREDTVPRTVIDRVVSSYTPNLRALRHARRPRPGRDGDTPVRALGVAMPHTPDARAIPRAVAETDLLRSRTRADVMVLEGPQATRDRLLTDLPAFDWVHLACHAHGDLDAPSNSRLLVHDHLRAPLTVAEIVRLRLDRAEFAYLSACATSRRGTVLPDEAIHLAAAFQLAGFSHVVSTLWRVADRHALQVATEVYDALGAGGAADAAHALHRATRHLRDRWEGFPEVWAAYIHMGA